MFVLVDSVGEERRIPCAEAVKRTRNVLAILALEKSWRMLMEEGKLRPSSLWNHLTWNISRTPYPHLKDFVSYVWIRRSLEILCV